MQTDTSLMAAEEAGGMPADLLISPPLPEGLDPLADGILMLHQRLWVEDQSPLKACPKGRRTGITFAEALDDTLIAATKRSEGGDNVFYIGDTKEKGLEFIRYVAHFAVVVAKELHAHYEEFLFEDAQPDGSTKFIAAYRVRFASGHVIAALSSRPANIRGLQGVVVIDEAAFHKDVALVIDAVNALLIWGGRIRIISSHNGEDNPFNRLLKDTVAGHFDYSIHTYTFDDAVRNGLYERYCLIRGLTPSAADKAGWYNRIIRAYGNRTEARDEELFCQPRKSSGSYFNRMLIEGCQAPGIPVLPFVQSDAFVFEDSREKIALEWCEANLRPILDAIPRKHRCGFGQDFGRNGDLSVIWVLEDAGLLKKTACIVELRNIPFDVQRVILFWIIDHLPNFHHGKLDARGNGQAHAEAALQKYGSERIECVMFTAAWYAQHFPNYKAAYEDKVILVPANEDLISDHRLVVLKAGRPGISDKHVIGTDGEQRHGDSAVAGVLAFAAMSAPGGEYDYRPANNNGVGHNGGPPIDDDDGFAGRRFGNGAW